MTGIPALFLPAPPTPGQPRLTQHEDGVHSERDENLRFLRLLRQCRPFGGLLRDCDALGLADVGKGALSDLARGVVRRDLLSVQWDGTVWLPVFQFDWPELKARSDLIPLIKELRTTLNDWELTQWFVSPHSLLGELAPLDALREGLRAVYDAAVSDRFHLTGAGTC